MLTQEEFEKILKLTGKSSPEEKLIYKDFQLHFDAKIIEKNIESIIGAKSNFNKAEDILFHRNLDHHNKEYTSFKIFKINLVKKKENIERNIEEDLGGIFENYFEKNESLIKNYEENKINKEEENKDDEKKEEEEIISSSIYNYNNIILVFRLKFHDDEDNQNKNIIYFLNELDNLYVFSENFDDFISYKTNIEKNNNMKIKKKLDYLSKTRVNSTNPNFKYFLTFNIIEREVDGFFNVIDDQKISDLSEDIIYSNINGDLIKKDEYDNVILEVKNNDSVETLQDLEKQIENNIQILKENLNNKKTIYLIAIKNKLDYEFQKIKLLKFPIIIISFADGKICNENVNNMMCSEFYLNH